jgi:hypothetical protein
MQKTFGGADRFFPTTYQRDWAVVRKVAEETGTPFNRGAYEKASAREEAARKKKSAHAASASAGIRGCARNPSTFQGIPPRRAGAA